MSLSYQDSHTELNFRYMRVDHQVESLLEFLLRRFHYQGAEEWSDAIYKEWILVDSQPASSEQILQNGQNVTYLRPDFLEPEVDREFEVIYEDNELIAVNKSGNLPTSPSGRYFKNTLVHVVQSAMNHLKLYTLHRLDRETSGLVMFAKTKEVAQEIAKQFRDQQIQKEYVALLEKPLPFEDGCVFAPLGPDPQSEIRIKQGVIPKGKPSRTRFIADGAYQDYHRIRVQPMSGRTHQIRVHVAYLGCPIAGDKLYGLDEQHFLQWVKRGEEYLDEQGITLRRQMLHAESLSFLHPVSGKTLTLKAPHPWAFG